MSFQEQARTMAQASPAGDAAGKFENNGPSATDRQAANPQPGVFDDNDCAGLQGLGSGRQDISEPIEDPRRPRRAQPEQDHGRACLTCRGGKVSEIQIERQDHDIDFNNIYIYRYKKKKINMKIKMIKRL